jgi:hypothetical protein
MIVFPYAQRMCRRKGIMLIIQAILSIILSLGLGASTYDSPSVPLSSPSDSVCMEDMECWDSATMGQDNTPVSAMEQDAWQAFGELGIVSPDPHQAVEYVETLDYVPSALPLGYFAVGSDTSPHGVHIMKWITIYQA